jgi:hypothetical protein
VSHFPEYIPTSRLRLSDVPPDSAPLAELDRFALTFDPTEEDPYKLDEDELFELSESSSLTRIRAHLFFEQRRWNHRARMPDDKTLAAIRKAIALIRARLT